MLVPGAAAALQDTGPETGDRTQAMGGGKPGHSAADDADINLLPQARAFGIRQVEHRHRLTSPEALRK
ncbi:hypothetical protein GCM10007890_38820 [Methylobacterium tardum]|uniref:Uncharacterized protein n=1 Tax=Methylobacterium tardum TaxID=374432 RepID=A0AA37TJ15_9HYPH|nr:hypothetical protein GCM10007890_38820 [Methylobacterium tardum]